MPRALALNLIYTRKNDLSTALLFRSHILG